MNNTLTKEKETLIDGSRDYKPSYIFDRYGNPTPETLEAFYESEHGLAEPITLEEFNSQLDEIFGR